MNESRLSLSCKIDPYHISATEVNLAFYNLRYEHLNFAAAACLRYYENTKAPFNLPRRIRNVARMNPKSNRILCDRLPWFGLVLNVDVHVYVYAWIGVSSNKGDVKERAYAWSRAECVPIGIPVPKVTRLVSTEKIVGLRLEAYGGDRVLVSQQAPMAVTEV